MKTVIITAAIWVSLFAGTIVTTHLLRSSSAPSANAAEKPPNLPDDGMEALRNIARKTQTSLIELDDSQAIEVHRVFLSSLHSAVGAAPAVERLRACKTFMRGSNRAREFVELSFEARDGVEGVNGDIGTLLYDVRVERASIALSESEATCVRSAVEGLVVSTPSAPIGRMATAMCFGNTL